MIAQLTNLATHSLILSMIERQVLKACMVFSPQIADHESGMTRQKGLLLMA
jgi:hypothetical protein